MMILISSCLVGNPCRYDGKTKINLAVTEFIKNKTEGIDYILVCPEAAGKLPIPREPGEIEGGNAQGVLNGSHQVKSPSGLDYTPAFLAGARAVCNLAKNQGATAAILKERSPSCGTNFVYDGSFSKKLVTGLGVCALLLQQMGLRLFSEENFQDSQVINTIDKA